MDLIENLKAALNGEEVEKVPAISATAAAVEEAFPGAEVSWPSAHQDAQEMARLGISLHKQAGLECARVPFDLTAEAEAFGCTVDLGGIYRNSQKRIPRSTCSSRYGRSIHISRSLIRCRRLSKNVKN